MACERWREMLSAQLDGENDPADRDLVEAHLAGCAGCRAWLDRAAQVNRLTRTAVAATPPDLADAVIAALPPVARTERARLVGALYGLLGAVGAGQLLLGLAQVGGGSAGGHSHAGAGLVATPGHLWHESAAWNVAVGAGFLLVALRRSRPTGLVPMLTAFVAMLLLLSVNDLTAGRVAGDRLVSHGFVLVGYLLVVALTRVAGAPEGPPAGRESNRWRVDSGGAERRAVRAVPPLRIVRRSAGGLPPATAVHLGERRAQPERFRPEQARPAA